MTHFELKHGAVVLTAPSGSGKTTIARLVQKAIPELKFSISATTRPPRSGEIDGVHYYFISETDFKARVAADEFLEYEEVYPGRYYGTLLSEITRIDESGPVLLDIDVKGAMRMKELAGDAALLLFVHPISIEEIGARLESRGTESDKWFNERIKRAEMELSFADKCDRIIYNDVLEEAVAETLYVVRQFLDARSARSGRKKLSS